MKSSGSQTRVLLGTVMLSSANISKIALQFLLVPILARLLGPKVFGLMSVAMSFILFANVLSEGGMGAALVRDGDQDHELRSTVFWLSFLVGSSLAVLECAIAWPLASAFSQPMLAPVLCALSPILILSASLSVSNAQIVRSQRFDVFAVADVACALICAGTGIGLALSGFGIWSLVAQQILLWTTKAVWVMSVTRFRPALVFNLKLARPLLRFSAANLAANVTDFLGKSAPTVIVSGVLGIAAAGQYSMGYQLTRVADMVVSSPINVTTFSAVAVAPNRRVAASFVMAAMRILTAILGSLCVGLMLTADIAAPLLLGPKWTETAPVLAALAPGSLLVCLYAFATAALLGRGYSGAVFKLTFLTSAATVTATFIGAHFSIHWAAAGFSIGAAMLVPLYAWRLARAIRTTAWNLVSSTAGIWLAVIIMTAVVLIVRQHIAALGPVFQLLIVVGVGVATFLSALFLVEGRQLRTDVAWVRRSGPENVTMQAPPPGVASQASEI